MAAKPLTTEAIALTEKKMDMSLEDIIKMSKTNVAKPMKQRISNRSQKFVKNTAQDKSAKVQRFTNTRSSLRQGALAQRRSNFQGNQFPLATEAARKAAAAPIRSKAFNQSRPFNVTKQRFGAKPSQKNASNGGGFIVKRQKANVVSWQKPQTLDTRFANMKEQRTRGVFSSHSQSQSQPSSSNNNNNNSGGGPRRNGNGVGQPRGVPWARNRFPNSY